MIKTLSSLSADAAVSLMTKDFVKEISYFANLESAEAVFDYLWDRDDAFHFVITDRGDFELHELHAAAQRRPETQFIVLNYHDEPPAERADNVVFIDDLQTLNELTASRLSL